MIQKWALRIENFGKIKEGSVDIRPMMLFVGNNNTGKSYVMTLLWGIIALGRSLFPDTPPSSEAYRKCDEWLSAVLGREGARVDEASQELFVDWFNHLLKQHKKSLVRKLFNYDLNIGHLSVTDYHRSTPLTIRWRSDAKRFSSRAENYVQFPYPSGQQPSEAERLRMITYICWKLLMDGLGSPMYPAVNLNSTRSAKEPLFLPASRTGFMLTYRALIQSLISKEFFLGDEDNVAATTQFTFPVSRFLQELVGLENLTNDRFQDVVGLLEQHAMGGEIHREASPVPAYTFRPRGLRKELPLHVTSSLVTELSPLVLFLKSQLDFHVLIMEEPEAHLHLGIQRAVAQALVRLSHKNLCVWLTTHSDTMFQQFNNLIKLSSLDDAKLAELGYSKEDILDPSSVAAYQFTSAEAGTTISRLPHSDRGFAAPTFNETLLRMFTETSALQSPEENV